MQMDLLTFIDTNIGVVALRRHEHAENRYFSQVWERAQPGIWKQVHYKSKENTDFSPGLLEALYQGASERGLPHEDWW